MSNGTLGWKLNSRKYNEPPVSETETSIVMNQLQKANIGSKLYNGALII